MQLTVETQTWPIAGAFTIARGAKTEALVVLATIEHQGHVGRGECVPYARYGETPESVTAQVEAVRPLLEAGAPHGEILSAMPAGAARNAVDCALWDLRAKQTGRRVASLICATPPKLLVTAYTISLGEPEVMAAKARAHASRALLKVKLGGEGDAERIRAVAAAAPDARLILDANESWREHQLAGLMAVAAECRAALIEQPLPAGDDAALAHIAHPVPVCADESVHVAAGLAGLRGRYDAINIKLDKAGGLTEALAMRDEARRLGFRIMVGCMVATSLSMAPAVLLAQEAQFVDLDGPLLLARDRPGGLAYAGSTVAPPEPGLWG